MARQQLEIERKFDVEEGFGVPDLSGVAGVGSVGEVVEHQLSASYYDTPDLRLARSKVTLRRRTGGTDAGWHVKLPAAAGSRRELHSPLGRAVKAPPKAVLDPVLGLVRRAPTAQVATLATRRLVTPLLGEDGRVLAEIADDHVTGTAMPTGPGEAAVVTTWREIEVELVEGDEELLGAVAAELVVSGARPSPSPSKLSRVLADRLAAAERPAEAAEDADPDGEPAGEPLDPLAAPSDAAPVTDAGPGSRTADTSGEAGASRGPKSGKKSGKKAGKKAEKARSGKGAAAPTAGEVVVSAVRDQVAALQTADLMVRTAQPDGVHQVRVASRRLRSIFAAFRPVLSREATDPLRDELQWLGAELSGARDAEVSLAHLRELVAAQPAELVIGPVAARLEQAELAGAGAPGAPDPGSAVLREGRYLDLLDALFDLLAEPPLTELADQPAPPVLAGVVGKTVSRLRAFVRTAEDAEAHDLALHDVRKAAKRVRYTGDVAAPVLGSAVADLVGAMKKVQEVLGDRQDTVVTREQCRELGRAALAAGEDPWTYGRLHALEEARSVQAERDFWALWPQLRPVLKGAAGKDVVKAALKAAAKGS